MNLEQQIIALFPGIHENKKAKIFELFMEYYRAHHIFERKFNVRVIEIQDTLDSRIKDAKQYFLEQFQEWLKENPDATDFDQFYQHCGANAMHEIADSNTPVYNSEIDDIYYLNGNELEDAYKSHGLYDEPPDNYRQVCIYCYIMDQIREYMNNDLNNFFDEWKEKANELEEQLDELVDAEEENETEQEKKSEQNKKELEKLIDSWNCE